MTVANLQRACYIVTAVADKPNDVMSAFQAIALRTVEPEKVGPCCRGLRCTSTRYAGGLSAFEVHTAAVFFQVYSLVKKGLLTAYHAPEEYIVAVDACSVVMENHCGLCKKHYEDRLN